jgi:hypothetical protein
VQTAPPTFRQSNANHLKITSEVAKQHVRDGADAQRRGQQIDERNEILESLSFPDPIVIGHHRFQSRGRAAVEWTGFPPAKAFDG